MSKTLLALALFGMTAGAALAQEVVVKIGHVAPLTGPQSHLGKDNENGARLALEDANAKGITIGGKKVKFELLSEDDAADPRTGTTVAQRLVDAGVKGVIGHLNSGTTIPASRIYSQAGIVQISPSATNPKYTTQGYTGAFRTITNDVQQGAALGNLASKLGTKVALIDDRTAYGQGLADEAAKAIKASGAQVVTREFTTDKATDFAAILTKIKAKNPDVIVYSGMDAQGGPMLRQIRQLGIPAKFATGDGGCSLEFIKLAGEAISDKAYCTNPGLPIEKMAGGAGFRERFKKRFGVDVQVYAPYAYDAATAMVQAMQKADSIEPAKYMSALKTLSFEGVSGKVSFDTKGDIKDGAVTVYQFADGKWVAR